MSKSKRRTKPQTRRTGETARSHTPTHTAATEPVADPPPVRPAKPPAKNVPMLIASTVLLVAWLCVLAYLAIVSLSQQAG